MTLATQGVHARKVDVVHTTIQSLPQSVPARGSIWPCLAPALVSGGVLWMCYFPLAWGWLGWIALVPLFGLVRAQATPRRIYWCAYLGGLVFFVPILQWMREGHISMYGAWSLLALYCAAYFPATLWFIRLLDRKTFLPLVLSVPIAWTAMEYARSFILTGFAWYYLGHTQHTMLALIQIADLGGVYLVSFLVAAVNAWLFCLLYQSPRLRDLCRWEEPKQVHAGPRAAGWLGRPALIYEAGALLVAFVCVMIYGRWRLDQDQFQQGPLVALLQTNIAQSVRDDARVADMIQQYDELTSRALGTYPQPELIIWPETSYLGSWYESSPRLEVNQIPEEWRRREAGIRFHLSRELVKSCPANHLLGMSTWIMDADANETRYNSALFVHKTGGIGGRYDKMHRVPFGEFVPWRDWLPFMSWLSPYEGNYDIKAGEKFTRFELGKHKFGVLICFEDTDVTLARRYLHDDADGRPVDFLVNMVNDGWFNGSSEHEEHLAISRFRAIECRRALARSVNMGISAVIDSNGRVLQPQELPPPGEPHTWKIANEEDLPVASWPGFKKTAGVLLARIPIDTRESFYARAGDWLGYGCWAILGGVFGWTLIQCGRRPEPQPVG